MAEVVPIEEFPPERREPGALGPNPNPNPNPDPDPNPNPGPDPNLNPDQAAPAPSYGSSTVPSSSSNPSIAPGHSACGPLRGRTLD